MLEIPDLPTLGRGELSLSCDHGQRHTSLTGDVRMSHRLFPFLPQSALLVSVATDSTLVTFGEKDLNVRFSPDCSAPIPLSQLAADCRLFTMLHLESQEGQDSTCTIDISVRDIQHSFSVNRLQSPVPEDLRVLCDAVLHAERIARMAGISADTTIVADKLVAQVERLRTMIALLGGTEATVWGLPDPPTDDKATALLSIVGARIGGYYACMSAAIVGAMTVDGRRTKLVGEPRVLEWFSVPAARFASFPLGPKYAAAKAQLESQGEITIYCNEQATPFAPRASNSADD